MNRADITESVQIKLYLVKESISETISVEKISRDKFKMLENSLFDFRLTINTEFTAFKNEQGSFEVISITSNSPYITHRFVISQNYRKQDYLMIAKELEDRGGFWQLDLNYFITVNIPSDFEYDIDAVMDGLGFKLERLTQ